MPKANQEESRRIIKEEVVSEAPKNVAAEGASEKAMEKVTEEAVRLEGQAVKPDEGAAKEAVAEAEKKPTEEFYEEHIFKKIDMLQFGMLSPKMIKKMAAAKIVTPELYDKEGYPVDGGLMDVRLGVIDPGLRCKTCGSKLKDCVGHFGYIELARPVIHVKFVPIIDILLKSVCKECSRVLIPEPKLESARGYLNNVEEREGIEARMMAAKELITRLKIKVCPYCKKKIGKITLEKPTTFIEGEKRLSPIEIRAIFENMKDEDLELLGLDPKSARPEWMILTVLPVPPVTMRPSITLESGERSEDDLTHKLGDIVRINQRLFENINAGAPEVIIEDLWDLLQYHITTYFDNSIPQLPPARHRSGQPLKTLTERIKSKEGRIRHNLAGKRTNFCARTVISPDPLLEIDEVGVPITVALKVTVAETVQPWNIDYLKKFVERGPREYPGANYVIRPDGKRKKITDETKQALLEELAPGYVVERHLIDGDIGVLNRQPSLHKMSMMCHRIKVLPYRTFRINPCVCAPYAADFDGDEMNLHVPQTEESRAEAELLMQVQTQVISPRYGLSIIGCIQDAITGNYLLTSSKEPFSIEEAASLLISVGMTDFSRLPNKKSVTGKEIFSVLLPKDLDFVGKSKKGENVVIKNGWLVEGTIDVATIGGEGEGILLRTLHQKYGAKNAIEILHKIFMLGNEYLMRRGFTTGIADTDLTEVGKEAIMTLLSEAELDVQKLIQIYAEGKLEAFPGRTLEETLELKILELLNRVRNKCGLVVSEITPSDNATKIMADSGARGSLLNLTMMAACVGQQALRGKRISYGYKGRTLSTFKRGDLGPDARGFIRSSYKSGLNPKEFFFGAITGRDSLMDTALRTPKSGYLYRRLANALQDIKVEYDGTVRDATGRIIQFEYGEDGLDVSKTEQGKINVDRIIAILG
ncbi:MAG: DNA-directed RNA polymerase subunit A' [Candidatus Woesearchaeota archaeon]